MAQDAATGTAPPAAANGLVIANPLVGGRSAHRFADSLCLTTRQNVRTLSEAPCACFHARKMEEWIR
jgi:hypothetical protein